LILQFFSETLEAGGFRREVGGVFGFEKLNIVEDLIDLILRKALELPKNASSENIMHGLNSLTGERSHL